MKVMCIREGWTWNNGFCYTPPHVGGIYTPTGTHTHPENGCLYYTLKEYPHPNPPEEYGFRVEHFAPLQDNEQPEEQIEELQTAEA